MLNYGQLPDREAFIRDAAKHCPYPIETTHAGEYALIAEAINQGIDAYLEAIAFECVDVKGRYSPRKRITILDAASLHTFLRRLIELDERESAKGDGGAEEAGALASAILYTLDYEWV